MIVEQVIIGFIIGVALFEIYYGWKLNQERKIIRALNRAWFTSHMYTFDEKTEIDKERSQWLAKLSCEWAKDGRE